jgi:hypothetical protein
MVKKKVTLVLYGADRTLWRGPAPDLSVRRLYPTRLLLEDRKLQGTAVDLNMDVLFDAGQAYVVMVTAKKHRPAWLIVDHGTFIGLVAGKKVERDFAILRLMLVPAKPVSADLGQGFAKLVARGFPLALWDQSWYDGLGAGDGSVGDASYKMALLNIEAKLRETYVDGRPLASFVRAVRRVNADRIFILVKAELKQMVEASADFAPAEGHKAPAGQPKTPAHPGGWKHKAFDVGNLQLCFSAGTEDWTGGGAVEPCYSVDADIDLKSGFGHVVEWLDNNVFGKELTNQTVVYKLLYDQGILPAYTLDQVTPAGEAKGSTPTARRRPRLATRHK